MSEPSLALSLKKLEAVAGFGLGYGRGANYSETAWSARQQADVTDCVDSGLRWFYYPAVLPGERVAHNWTFLRPYHGQTLKSGTNQSQLPDDFGGFESVLRLYGSGLAAWAVKHRSEDYIRSLNEAYPNRTGRPEVVTVQALKTNSPIGGQRFILFFHPFANQDYIIQFQYYVNPSALTAAYPWPYGGAQHAETLIAAVLAAAEERKHGERGVKYAQFMDRLKASVSLDRNNQPRMFGYNGDPGYNQGRGFMGLRHQLEPAAAVDWDR